MFDADDGIRWEGAEQPGAWSCFGADQVGNWDAIVMYDMPGLRFVGGETIHVDPPEDFQRRFLEMLDAGQGFVFLHHAMSAWPSWPAYADIVGGRFLYKPGELHGTIVAGLRISLRGDPSCLGAGSRPSDMRGRRGRL